MSQPAFTVGVDGSPASDAALVYACDDASARHVGVRAVTVWRIGPVTPEDHALAAEHRRGHARQVDATAVAPALARRRGAACGHLAPGEGSAQHGWSRQLAEALAWSSVQAQGHPARGHRDVEQRPLHLEPRSFSDRRPAGPELLFDQLDVDLYADLSERQP